MNEISLLVERDRKQLKTFPQTKLSLTVMLLSGTHMT